MTYKVKELPLSAEAFKEMLPLLTTEPEGAAAGCIFALNLMTIDEVSGKDSLKAMNPEVAGTMIQLAERQLKSKPYLIHSYFSGTSPSEGYVLPENLAIEFTTNKYSGNREDGRVKLFVACSGADTPRPVTVKRRKDGSWYAFEWSTLIVGIRPPAN